MPGVSVRQVERLIADKTIDDSVFNREQCLLQGFKCNASRSHINNHVEKAVFLEKFIDEGDGTLIAQARQSTKKISLRQTVTAEDFQNL
ncbi:MAG: hypothetical protein CMQ45_08185 [Gammaproteobacteria bacterium]|nr:hypothetical protein [Gammaproteobacteria bacterium]|tara:strand:- start:296 stop:562 length:267 start_codon:yes stop_codon:yes gene_type:complete